MPLNKAFISSTQVASSTPFDDTTGKGFNTPPNSATDVQLALEALRNHTIFISRTQATTLNGILTLSVVDSTLQFLTGTAAGYSIVLPDATTLLPGWHYKIDNTTNQTVTIKDGSGAILFVLGQSSTAEFTLQTNSSAAGTWVFWQTLINIGSGVITYSIASSTNFTTTSTTYVTITDMTLTPEAGTYGVWYNGGSILSTTPKFHGWSIFKNGIVIVDSERLQDTAHSNQNMVDSTMTIANFNGTDTCDVRVLAESGTLTITNRSLLMIRLGT